MSMKQPPSSNGVTLSLEELIFFKQHTVHWLPPAKSLWSQLHGQHHSSRLGRGMDFAEVRQYQPGDDIRSIDWRVTARTGKTHTKVFCEEKEKPVILYLDFSSSMQFGSTLMLKSVLMAHMASLISWISVAQKDRIGAVIDDGQTLVEVKPTSRSKGPLQIIQKMIDGHQSSLARLGNTTSQTSMSDGLKTLTRLCPKGSEIVLLSDFTRLDESNTTFINQLNRHNRIKVIQIIDPLERGKTTYRGVELVSNRIKNQWIDFSSKKTRQQIEHAFTDHQQSLKSLCHSQAIHYSSLSSDSPLLQQLSG
ncbi:DUF58 domain-containing protein [Vibrio marisflavi]|uniref:DUF58 domain-containing protein n=1 Tax=Vibrio marisflavi CECT 7928 TaxID=634439 RepID=A0ABM9A1C0_9VIBR|nr:DUF58 domain-containing protein [Vibrio marisflavi]CAH0537539.1 hypothetical protein VMF7928_01160 [Vibrio marisflavi CECT 7928]